MFKKLMCLALTTIMLCGTAVAADPFYDYADALNKVGVFKGMDNGAYNLTTPPTRVQGLIMLLRLTGQEGAALAHTGKVVFKDVPAWASPYVSYAYANGITKGMSKTEFGTDIKMNSRMYFTFLLRSLNYNDAAGDFTYDTSIEKAKVAGIIAPFDERVGDDVSFLRGHMAYYSFVALFTDLKGKAGVSLIENLEADGKIDPTKGLDSSLFAGYYNKVISD